MIKQSLLIAFYTFWLKDIFVQVSGYVQYRPQYRTDQYKQQARQRVHGRTLPQVS